MGGVPLTLGVNLANMVLGVFTGVVTARVMEPDGRGLLIALTLWSATIAQFSLVGMDEATVYSSRGSTTAAVRTGSKLRTTLMRQAAVGMALTAAVCTVVALKGDRAALAPALSLVLLVPLNIFNQMRLAPLRVGQFLRMWNLLRLLPALTYASLILGLAVTRELTVSTGCIAVVLGSMTTAAACWIFPRGTYAAQPSETEPALEATDIPEVRSYGRNLVFANLPSMANQRLDQLLLGLAASPQLLGIYAVAVSIAGVVQMLGTTLEQVLFPRLTAGTVSSDKLPRVIAVTVVSVIGVGLAIAMIAGPLISLVYGRAYLGAQDALYVLLLGAVSLVVTLILTAEAKSQGRLRDLRTAQLVGVFVTITALLPAVYWLGILGAALASTVAYTTTLAMLFVYRARYVRSDPS